MGEAMDAREVVAEALAQARNNWPPRDGSPVFELYAADLILIALGWDTDGLAHDYCTEDDCPCFAAGVIGVAQQLAEAIHSLNDVEQGLQGTLDAAQEVKRGASVSGSSAEAPMGEPHRSLSEELAELERTNPSVRRASLKVDIATSRILGCKHVLPCKPGRCDDPQPAPPHRSSAEGG